MKNKTCFECRYSIKKLADNRKVVQADGIKGVQGRKEMELLCERIEGRFSMDFFHIRAGKLENSVICALFENKPIRVKMREAYCEIFKVNKFGADYF